MAQKDSYLPPGRRRLDARTLGERLDQLVQGHAFFERAPAERRLAGQLQEGAACLREQKPFTIEKEQLHTFGRARVDAGDQRLDDLVCVHERKSTPAKSS